MPTNPRADIAKEELDRLMRAGATGVLKVQLNQGGITGVMAETKIL